nr:SurA N-terminal domain-containing protein [Oscillospiraceae bacterium]
MSASTEKKQRQAAREAGTDKKILAQEKAAKEQARNKRRWTIGTAAVAIVIVLVLLLNSPLATNNAYSVGDRKYSAAEVSYSYARQFMTFANQYGSYASLFGLDTSSGINGLDKQDCPYNDGTWKDYFLDAAKNELLQTRALLDYAAENGLSLEEAEVAEIDAALESYDAQAVTYGYSSTDQFLSTNYGAGVTRSLVRSASMDSALASKAAQALSDSFTYTEEELEEQYRSYEGLKDYFDYSYVVVEAHDDAAEEGAEVTEEQKAAARQTAEAVVASFKSAEGDDFAEKLRAAAEAEGLTASRSRSTSGSSLVAASEWMMDSARKAGDITVEADADGDHVYVVLFLGRNDNHYKPVSVRHILVKAEASEDGTYSEEAKAAAKARAEEILAEYEAGSKTEERFGELANLYSEDG